MQSNTTNINIKEVETQLREEKSKFAKAFHRGKSMTELKDVVDKIHMLEQKFTALTLFNYNRQ